jgi:Protein of unknown function (DUF1640)
VTAARTGDYEPPTSLSLILSGISPCLPCANILFCYRLFTMAAPRLPFLYPSLSRSARSCKPASHSTRVSSYNPVSQLAISIRHRCAQSTYPRRYGPATESRLPPPSWPKEESVDQPFSGPPSGKGTPQTQRAETPQDQTQTQDARKVSKDAAGEAGKNDAVESTPANGPGDEQSTQTTASESEAPGSSNQGENHSGGPPDPVPQISSDSSSLISSEVPRSTNHKLPHLAPPRYIHHFDTYSTVKDLEKGGFVGEQATTIMKAIRGILQEKLNLAQASLTSKSDIQNESYLFKAACSELQSSMQTSRNAEIQKQRSSRTHLQHEVDIVSQRMSQELAGLKDDLKGMFNSHKMTTRELQRSLDTAIQELNYKITVSLNSDGKSAIEGLRWILTRRAASAIATSASKSFQTAWFLYYYRHNQI